MNQQRRDSEQHQILVRRELDLALGGPGLISILWAGLIDRDDAGTGPVAPPQRSLAEWLPQRQAG